VGGVQNPIVHQLSQGRLTWWEELGVGYFPVDDEKVYNEAYFKRYQEYAATAMGVALTSARMALVEKYWGTKPMVDIGIGSGQFVEMRNRSGARTYGWDVNPAGLEWLRQRSLGRDPVGADCVSMWDVLEHMHDYRPLINSIKCMMFVSIPIFKDVKHVLQSKHYRKDEHVWYFTIDGFVRAMDDLNFTVVECNKMETKLGREDIYTFALSRQSGRAS
jgi:SAM-dependent methyltransferase